MEMVMQRTTAQKWKKAGIGMLAGAVTGFLAAYGFMNAVETGSFGELGGSEKAASMVGLIYIVTALAVSVGVVSPRFGARFLNVEDTEELQEQRSMLAYSGVGMLLLGAMLLVAAFSGPAGAIAGETALVLIGALMLVTIVALVRQWKYTDELMRSVSGESVSVAYYLLAIVGGGWALAAHQGMAQGPAPLDWLTMMWGFILLGAFIAAGRRGMLNPR